MRALVALGLSVFLLAGCAAPASESTPVAAMPGNSPQDPLFVDTSNIEFYLQKIEVHTRATCANVAFLASKQLDRLDNVTLASCDDLPYLNP